MRPALFHSMFNDTLMKISGTVLLLVICAVLIFHYWPVVVALLALFGFGVLIHLFTRSS
jgi:hypothetical protein